MSWIHGIDVSGHQGVIDWDQVPDFVRFCYIKVAEGSGSQRKHNAAAERNFDGARSQSGVLMTELEPFAGCRGREIVVGAYQYGRPDTKTHLGLDDARREAASFIARARYVPGDLPPCLDLESAVAEDDVYNARWCIAWANAVIEALGVSKLVLYTTSPAYYKYLRHVPAELMAELERLFFLFWAEYPRKKGHPNSGINNDFGFCSQRPPKKLDHYKNERWDAPDIWQWTGYGELPGFKGYVDRNVMTPQALDLLRSV